MTQASGKDVRDILEISARNSGESSTSRAGALSSGAGPSSAPGIALRPPSAPPKPPTLKKVTKPRGRTDGIHKELQALLGDNAPSLAIAHSEAKALLGRQQGESATGFRPKFKRKERKAKGWRWVGFKSPARSDELVLYHWVPADDQEANRSADDSIARRHDFSIFNTNSGVYSYSNEEYSQHLKDDGWSKEETDYLIDLCQKYDLRFVVIADRWDWPASPNKHRSMEDLKARYYAICRRLIRSRISVEDMESRQQLLQTYSFDKNREVERKRLLQRLFTRTPAQLAEEEALYVEARRLEQNEAKFSAEREDLLKLLGGWERVPNVSGSLIAEAGAGLGPGSIGPIPGTPGAAAEVAALGSDGRRRKRKLRDATHVTDDDAASTSGRSTTATGSGSAALTAKQKAELKQAQFDETHHITRFDPESTPLARPPYPFLVGTPSMSPPVAPSPHNPSSSHGVYLRSTRLLAPRQPYYNRTMQTLSEMRPSVGPRLIFPTRQNCEKWEGLLGAVTSGLEMKKQTDRVESELRIAKSRLASLQQAIKSKESAISAVGGSSKLQARPSSNSFGSSGGRTSVMPRMTTQQLYASEVRVRSSRSRTPAATSIQDCTVLGSMTASPVEGGILKLRKGASLYGDEGDGEDDRKRREKKHDDDNDDDDDDNDEWKNAKEGDGRTAAEVAVGEDAMNEDDDDDEKDAEEDEDEED